MGTEEEGTEKGAVLGVEERLERWEVRAIAIKFEVVKLLVHT